MLQDKLISYSKIFLVGVVVGILTRLTDLLPAGGLWAFESIATLFGFWIVSVTVLVKCSSSHKNAGLNVLLYMVGMTISFYVSQYVLGQFWSKFDNGGFKTSLCITYLVLSGICGIGGYVLYFWNQENKLRSVLLALPVSALLAEGTATLIYFLEHKTYLFQVLFDWISALILGILFYKKSSNKAIYFLVMLVVAVIIYAVIYGPFLNI